MIPDAPWRVVIVSQIPRMAQGYADLVRSLDAMADSSRDRFIFLRADRAVPYGELMDVLEIMRAGGYSKIKLVALEGVPDSAVPPSASEHPKP